MNIPNSHSPDSRISIWLVEDDSRYRQTIAYLLNHTTGFRCDHVFFTFEELQDLLEGEKPWDPPAVVLLDIGLPGRDGIEGARYLKTRLPEVPILMLTGKDEPEIIFEALKAGASGYLLKETHLDEAIAAIRAAVRGGTLLPEPVASKVLQFFSEEPPQTNYGLTQRETQVLCLMSTGLAQKQIADALSISPHTVDNHVRHIYEKLHVRSGLEAVAKALKERLI
ncbi:MAG: response regulator transcription factor [Rhodothermales bacterium]